MIKKAVLTLGICLIALSTAYGQKDFKPYWNVGVGFGPTFSSVDFAESATSVGNAIKTKNLTQYHGGIAVRYITEKNLGFIVEMNYAQQGWEQDFSRMTDVKDKGFIHSHKTNYFEMPFLTHIYFGNKLRFVINLGPKISFLMSETEELNEALASYLGSGEAPSTFVSHQYYRDLDKKFDYGILGGLGVELQTGVGNFMLEGRYYFGLADIYNNSKADYFSRSANRIISAKLTYYVKLF